MLFKLILIFLVLEYLRPGDFIAPLHALHLNSFLLPVFIFLVSLAHCKRSLKDYFMSTGEGKILLFLVFLHICSLVMSQVLPEVNAFPIYKSTRYLVGYVLVFFFLVNEIADIEKLKRILTVLVFVHLLVIWVNFHVIAKATHADYLVSGVFFGDGNDFALALNVMLPFAFYLGIQETRRVRKTGFYVIGLVFLFTIVFSASRGGALGLGASLLYLVLLGNRKLKSVFVSLAVLILVANFAPKLFFERMATISDYENESSARARVLAWKGAAKIAFDHPLTGVGPGNFMSAYGTKYRPEGMSPGDAWRAAHSVYFQTLAELGFPGFLALTSLIVLNIWKNRKLKRKLTTDSKSKTLLTHFTMSWVGYSVSAGFLSVLYYPHIFMLCALNVSARTTLMRTEVEGKW